MKVQLLLTAFLLRHSFCFQGTSPRLLYLTDGLSSDDRALLSGDDRAFTHVASDALSKCNWRVAIIIEQVCVHASDWSQECTPRLNALLQKPENVAFTELGRAQIDVAGLAQDAVSACEAELHTSLSANEAREVVSDDSSVRKVLFWPAIDVPQDMQRCEALKELDQRLGWILDELQVQNVLVVMTSTPLEVESKHSLDGWLKRVRAAEQRKHAAATMSAPSGLFHEYQFFDTGAWLMYITVFSILIPALYVSVKSIAGINISYGAFDRDTVQSTKKNQ